MEERERERNGGVRGMEERERNGGEREEWRRGRGMEERDRGRGCSCNDSLPHFRLLFKGNFDWLR